MSELRFLPLPVGQLCPSGCLLTREGRASGSKLSARSSGAMPGAIQAKEHSVGSVVQQTDPCQRNNR